MGDWYTIGVCAGLGVAIGILAAVSSAALARGAGPAAVVGLGIGLLVENWQEAVGRASSAASSAGSVATPIVAGALRRGGTRRAGWRCVVARSRAVCRRRARVRPGRRLPEAVALPALGAAARSREPERHAGLRTLARD